MNISMGSKIKELRRRRGLSQKELANHLGVSFQTVSKWENDVAMPDVSLIPVIAYFFDVSTDELFDYERINTERKIEELCAEAAKLRYENPAKAEEILKQGLKQYPANEIILNNLLYTMRSPERNQEVVEICKSILEVTKLDDVKYDVLRILAETYHAMGEQALIKPTLEQIPEIYFSKVELVAKLLDGAEALEVAMLQALLSRDDLLDMLSRAAQLYHEKGEKEKAEDYAALTRKLYALFEGRTDMLDYNRGREQEWLKETIWPRLDFTVEEKKC